MKKFNKKAQEFQYIVFLSVFFVVMGIIASIFGKVLIEKEKIENPDNTGIGVLEWVSDALGHIPYVGSFMSMMLGNASLLLLTPYLAWLLGALIAIPMGYVILRLIRGGG